MNSPRTFPVRFQGQWIECQTPGDAAAMQWAGDLIDNMAPLNIDAESRVMLTLTLYRYDRYRAATALRRRLRVAGA